MDEHDPTGPPPASPGERAHLDRLVPVVYEELKALAGKLLKEKSDGVTLAPTSLVHEAYLRLLDQRRMDWQDRIHFLYIAARTRSCTKRRTISAPRAAPPPRPPERAFAAQTGEQVEAPRVSQGGEHRRGGRERGGVGQATWGCRPHDGPRS